MPYMQPCHESELGLASTGVCIQRANVGVDDGLLVSGNAMLVLYNGMLAVVACVLV